MAPTGDIFPESHRVESASIAIASYLPLRGRDPAAGGNTSWDMD